MRGDALSPWKSAPKAPGRPLWLAGFEAEDETSEDLVGADDEVLQPEPNMPIARWRGTLNIVGLEVPCYVLDTGEKIIGRTSATELLTGIKGGGALEKYIGVKALEPFISSDLVLERMVPFRLLEVEGLEKAVKGLPSDFMIEVCQGFVAALQLPSRIEVPAQNDRSPATDGDQGQHVSVSVREGWPRGADR